MILACVIAAALAVPIPLHYADSSYDLEQYNDLDGSYHFSYASDDASRVESRLPSGQVKGAYSYVDTDGILQKVQYVGDENGFQVYGTNLPIGSTAPPKETPEVLEATAEHFALVDQHVAKVALAKKYEQAYRAQKPEIYQHSGPFQFKVMRHYSFPATIFPVESNEVPTYQHQIQHHVLPKTTHYYEKPQQVVEEQKPVVEYHAPQVEYYYVPEEQYQYLDQPVHPDLPVPPEEDYEIQVARAKHLAEVERLKAEHLAAVYAAHGYA